MMSSSTFYGHQARVSERLILKRGTKLNKDAELPTPAKKRDKGVIPSEGKMKQVYMKSAESYQALIEKNIAEKKAFLASLGIDKFKLESLPVPAKPSRPPRMPVVKVSPTQRRKSLRLQSRGPDNLVQQEQEEVPEIVKREGPLSFMDVLEQVGASNEVSFLTEGTMKQNLTQFSKKVNPRDFKRCEKAFSRLAIDDSTVAKVVPSRITALCVHPSLSVTLIAAGDKRGYLGFLKLDEQGSHVETYSPHTSGLMCLKVNKREPHRIYSGSYDDTLRCADIERGIFDEVFRCPDDKGVMYFTWMLDGTTVVAHSDGAVSLLDFRTRAVPTSTCMVHDRKVRTVDAHPQNCYYFLTGSTDGTAKLWDARKMAKKRPEPISMLAHHRSCCSAFFSPVTGNKILTTSFDDTLRVFSCSKLTADIKMQVSLRHNNMTGRWLTPFKAVWLPESEDFFLVGSMEYPRRIEVYSPCGTLHHILTGDSLGSVCSLIDIHPDRFVLAGGNSSGKVHTFLEQ